jgi:hypothetical protein
MRTLTLDQADRIRAQRHRAVLLYITDRCPVGCAHCSVDALPRGARPADAALLERLVDGLCGMERLSLVGISGGEPFMEPRALQMASEKLAGAAKRLVLYTSGNWGRDDGTAPRWTGAVLARAACVVLSTDSYHAARIPDARFVAALRAAADAGTWIAVQVLGSGAQIASAERLLVTALGSAWADRAEIRPTELLTRGRGAQLPAGRRSPARQGLPGRSFGACHLVQAPVVRYDGRLTACCNEDVVTGHGPAALHAIGRGSQELRDALAAMEREPFLAAIGAAGPGALTRLPRFRELGERDYPDICALCWALLGQGAGTDPAVQAAGMVLR